MGTYRQPSLVLDKSFETINKNMAEFQKNLMAQMQANTKKAREEEKLAKKAAKEAQKQNHEYNEYGRKIEADLTKLKPLFMDDSVEIETSAGSISRSVEQFEEDRLNISNGVINPATGVAYTNKDLGYEDNFDFQEYIDSELDGQLEDEVGGAADDLKVQVRTLYKELAKHQKGSPIYENIVSGIEARLTQAPVMFNLLDNTSNNVAGGYDYDGNMIAEAGEINNIVLRDNQPKFELRSEMTKNIINKTNQGRFRYVFTPDGKGGGMSSLVYTNPKNKEAYEVSYETLVNNVKSGTNGLLEVSSMEPLNNISKDYFKPFFDSEYKGAIETTTQNVSSLNNAQDVRTRTKTKIKNVEQANNLLWDKVNNFIDSGGLSSNSTPTYTQNLWQILGGKGTYDPDKHQEKAKDLMYSYMLKTYGQQDVVDTTTSQTELKDSKGEYAKDRLTSGLRLTAEGQKGLAQGNSKDLDQTGRAEFGYQDLWNNYKSLTSGSGNTGIVELLSDLPYKSTYTYNTGAQIASQFEKQLADELVGLTDATEIAELTDAYNDAIKAYKQNPTATYRTNKANTDSFKKHTLLQLDDWDRLMNEIKWLTSPEKKSFEQAMRMLDKNEDQAMRNDERKPLPGTQSTT